MTNQARNGTIKLDGETIKWIENFKNLDSMMLSSADIKVRKGQAWVALEDERHLENQLNFKNKNF